MWLGSQLVHLILLANVQCMAEAIYFEARGESLVGKLAVTEVITNRMKSKYYPTDVCQVVNENRYPGQLHKCQFSYECDGLVETIDNPVAWTESVVIAERVLTGDLWGGSVGQSTMYHACAGPNATTPKWDWSQVDFYAQVGNHCYYTEKRVVPDD